MFVDRILMMECCLLFIDRSFLMVVFEELNRFFVICCVSMMMLGEFG